jgi:hypothetical protein
METPMPPLSDAAIRNAKPGASPIKLFDGGGLYLLINHRDLGCGR